MGKEMLVVVDMLNDFIHPIGNLFFTQGYNIVENVKENITKASLYGHPVVYLMDSHDKYDKEFEKFPEHCIKYTWGSDIFDNLHPNKFSVDFNKLYYIHKKRYSGFYGTLLNDLVTDIEPTHVTVVGVCTSICVMDTVGEFANRDIQTIVPVDSVADFDNEMHEFSLKRMKNIYDTILT